MFGLNNLKRALERLTAPKQEGPERWTATGMAAFYGLKGASTSAGIREISSVGVILNTNENLPAGEIVNLRLLKGGAPELSAELEISLQAQVAGQEEGGVALVFVLPPGLNPVLWEVLLRDIVSLTDPDDVLEAFRTLRTTLFLCRLCPSGADNAIQLLGGELDHDRTATLFKIASAVENQLAAEPDGARMRAHPKLVANILGDGSWAADQLTFKFWVGLFISSCSVDAADDSNQIFVDLLVHLTPTEARIFSLACERALQSAPETGGVTSAQIVLTPDEIVKLTGVHDLTRNATDLAYLFNLGLIRKVFDFTSYVDMDKFDITPSRLGLELYRRCHGHREKVDPQLVESAREHLAVFFPPPLPSAFEKFTPLEQEPPAQK